MVSKHSSIISAVPFFFHDSFRRMEQLIFDKDERSVSSQVKREHQLMV